MTVVVACRAADGALVFGADRLYSADNETREAKKLAFHPMANGATALIGMAAEDASQGFSRTCQLRIALNRIAFEQEPLEVIERTMNDCDSFGGQNEAAAEVEILCGIDSPAFPRPKLLGIRDRKPHDLDEKPFFCIGSGAGAAEGFLKLASKRLHSLRDVQIAVCASVWLAKRVDRRCGGGTNILWLDQHSKGGELEVERVELLESYIEASLTETLALWIADAPF